MSPPAPGSEAEGPHARQRAEGEGQPGEGPGRRPAAGWLVDRITGRAGHSGAIVPVGWGLYNAVWLGVMTGMAQGRPAAIGTTWPLYLYSGAVSITMLFAAAIVFSRWRHPVEPRQRDLGVRGDAGLCGALGFCFGGLAVVYGSWWAPFSFVMFVMAIWLAVKDVTTRHRSSSSPSASGEA